MNPDIFPQRYEYSGRSAKLTSGLHLAPKLECVGLYSKLTYALLLLGVTTLLLYLPLLVIVINYLLILWRLVNNELESSESSINLI
jgi:hypothetical protein